MQSKLSHQPNPSRFRVYVELPDGKGFKTKDSNYIYLFDKYGGWYDEFNNYYNPNGQPQDPPSDEDDDFERVVLADDEIDDQDDDYYENQYGSKPRNKGYRSDEDSQDEPINNQNQTAVAKNLLILRQYPVKTALRVDYENMVYKVTKQQILKHYRSKVKGILNVIMNKQNGEFIGEGYFICEDINVAEKLVQLQGQKFCGKQVFFIVEDVHQFLSQPVTNNQKGLMIQQQQFDTLVKKSPKIQQSKEDKSNKKKFVTKQGQKPSSKPSESKPQPLKPVKLAQHLKTVQPVKPVEPVKPVQPLKPVQPEWLTCQGDFFMFPLRDSFLNWMNSLGYKQQIDYKIVAKIESKDKQKRLKTISIRKDVWQKVNGKTYEKEVLKLQITK